jgi:hypothetical protein
MWSRPDAPGSTKLQKDTLFAIQNSTAGQRLKIWQKEMLPARFELAAFGLLVLMNNHNLAEI